MPKTPNSSRWFLFQVPSAVPDIRKHLQKALVEHSQWLVADGITHGYLYFPSTRPILRKKQWIPGATYTYTTKEEIIEKYTNKDTNLLNAYGSNPLIEPKQQKPPTEGISEWFKLKNDGVDIAEDDVASEEEDESYKIPKPYALELSNKTIISKNTVAILLMTPEEQQKAIDLLDESAWQIYDAERLVVKANHEDYYRKLIQAQYDNYGTE